MLVCYLTLISRLPTAIGPEINTKEEAMKTLGIEKTEDEAGLPVKVK